MPEEKKTTKKAPLKKTASTKKTQSTKTKKAAPKKTTTSKEPAKKTPTKKIVKPAAGISVKQKKNDTENLLDILSVTPSVQPTKPATSKKAPAKKPAAKAQSKKPAAKVPVKAKHRTKLQTKEEKQLYKRLSDSFNYVANLTMVIEERTMDKEQITDLTLGEIHVLEVVNKELEMPMTKVANQLKITVGSLTTCVNRLVKKEYLARVRDDVDHRVIKVSTTPKAKKILKLHDAFHEEILLSVLDGITLKDATKVMEQFERTLENYINPKEKNYESPITTSKKKK